MKRTNKKGFTIVELVIVIAVIAILAAVLIPTFVSLTQKANRSADQQAVVQMNKLLTAEAAGGEGPQKIQDVKAILAENGYNHKLDPLFKGYYFAWIAEKNVIVLVEDEKVVYPKKYADYDMFERFYRADESRSQKGGFDAVLMTQGMDSVKANIDVTSGTTLTLTNVTIDATDGADNRSAIKPSAGSVYISDTTIKGNAYAFAQNLNHADNPVCIVENSTMDGYCALYIGCGNWTFENCTFIGTVTIAGGNVTFKNCTFTAKTEDTGIAYDSESFYNTGTSGPAWSQNAIVIIEGRNAEDYESGKVTFTGCTVTNAEGANVSTEGGANYRFCTIAGVANPNNITVEWN